MLCHKFIENTIVFDVNKAIHPHNYLTAACHLKHYNKSFYIATSVCFIIYFYDLEVIL